MTKLVKPLIQFSFGLVLGAITLYAFLNSSPQETLDQPPLTTISYPEKYYDHE